MAAVILATLHATPPAQDGKSGIATWDPESGLGNHGAVVRIEILTPGRMGKCPILFFLCRINDCYELCVIRHSPKLTDDLQGIVPPLLGRYQSDHLEDMSG
jgi:hypothetical protein